MPTKKSEQVKAETTKKTRGRPRKTPQVEPRTAKPTEENKTEFEAVEHEVVADGEEEALEDASETVEEPKSGVDVSVVEDKPKEPEYVVPDATNGEKIEEINQLLKKAGLCSEQSGKLAATLALYVKESENELRTQINKDINGKLATILEDVGALKKSSMTALQVEEIRKTNKKDILTKTETLVADCKTYTDKKTDELTEALNDAMDEIGIRFDTVTQSTSKSITDLSEKQKQFHDRVLKSDRLMVGVCVIALVFSFMAFIGHAFL